MITLPKKVLKRNWRSCLNRILTNRKIHYKAKIFRLLRNRWRAKKLKGIKNLKIVTMRQKTSLKTILRLSLLLSLKTKNTLNDFWVWSPHQRVDSFTGSLNLSGKRKESKNTPFKGWSGYGRVHKTARLWEWSHASFWESVPLDISLDLRLRKRCRTSSIVISSYEPLRIHRNLLTLSEWSSD
jgi:hypothetical protein